MKLTIPSNPVQIRRAVQIASPKRRGCGNTGGGTYGTIEELAAAEKINTSYLSRVLRLTLLAPEIVEAILDGRQPVEMTLAALTKPFPVS